MLDFLMISCESTKDGIKIFPNYKVDMTSDLMIRNNDFYAIWDEENKSWSTNEYIAIRLIDEEIKKYSENFAKEYTGKIKVEYLWDSSNGRIDK